MKLRLNYALMPALVFSGAAGAAEIYNKDGHKLDLNGTIAGVHHFNSNKPDSDSSYMRFGFKFDTQINEQLAGYGQWQYQALLDRNENDPSRDSTTRLGFIGLRFDDYGSFDYGRNWGVLYDVLSFTDKQYEFGGSLAADGYMSQRASNVATYRSKNLFGLAPGLNLALQAQGANAASGEKDKGRAIHESNGSGYGMSLTYDLGWNISIGGAYTRSKRTEGQKKLKYGYGGDHAQAYSSALKYDDENLYLAMMYTNGRNLVPFGEFDDDKKISGVANKAQLVEIVAQYMFDFGLKPSLSYIQTVGSGIEHYGRQDLKKFVEIGAEYSFNKNMAAFIDYKLNLIKGDEFQKQAGINKGDIVAVGMTYQF